MQRDPRAFLWDVRDAAQAIQTFVPEQMLKNMQPPHWFIRP